MALFPKAHFIINNVENINTYANGEVEGASEVEGINKIVYGDFTMLGKTFHIYFPAKITVDGDLIEVEAKFKLDRTKWGMDYGADPALGDHHIHPKVYIILSLQQTGSSAKDDLKPKEQTQISEFALLV
jgi:polyisoprenoid-binding protein YceI